MSYFNSKIWLRIEFFLTFLILPILPLFIELPRYTLFIVLWIISIGAGVYLWRSKAMKSFLCLPKQIPWNFCLRIILVTILIIVSALLIIPERFMTLPLERPELFLKIILFYPLLSAIPQEILYRSFMKERYQSLTPLPLHFIIISSLTFAMAHMAFQNYIALVFSFIGGLLFSLNYSKHHSLSLVSIEHSIYGLVIFASGWGWYFYLGAGHQF